ncbi:MAG TPA: phosphodiester glycosidase family protein [Trueperaceae bacterium]
MPAAARLAARAALWAIALAVGAASAQEQLAAAQGPLYRLPGATATVDGDAVTIAYRGEELVYVAGLGWLTGAPFAAPVVSGSDVLVDGETLEALGVTTPRVEAVRTSGDAEVRIVLDVPDLDPAALAGFSGQGAIAEGQALELRLPPLVLPAAEPEELGGVEVSLAADPDGTSLRLTGPAFTYEYFALTAPTRVVVDVVPRRVLDQPEISRALAPGVDYRRFNYRTAGGGSVVHVVSIAPGSGQFRVVGESKVPRTVSQLADGALVALNAGYFDTATFEAIGYLLVDHGLLSLPSRGRASVAFGAGKPVIDRVKASVRLHTPRGVVEVGPVQDGVGVVSTPGALAGRPDMGVLVVKDGVVVENKVGPREVPDGDAYALVYPPTNRDIALLDTGDRVTIEARIDPPGFSSARWAVEAGPLLLKDGVPAYEPAVEGFPTGERILDGLTQQAAIGVRPDGTTLLVVAETMRARDLVGLFLALGASDAMRLDSGSSTTLVLDGDVVNRRTERRVVSAIVFLPEGR